MSGALQVHAAEKKLYFLLQVTPEFVSGTASDVKNSYQYYKSYENLHQVLQVIRAVTKCAMKSKVCMIKEQIRRCTQC